MPCKSASYSTNDSATCHVLKLSFQIPWVIIKSRNNCPRIFKGCFERDGKECNS